MAALSACLAASGTAHPAPAVTCGRSLPHSQCCRLPLLPLQRPLPAASSANLRIYVQHMLYTSFSDRAPSCCVDTGLILTASSESTSQFKSKLFLILRLGLSVCVCVAGTLPEIRDPSCMGWALSWTAAADQVAQKRMQNVASACTGSRALAAAAVDCITYLCWHACSSPGICHIICWALPNTQGMQQMTAEQQKA